MTAPAALSFLLVAVFPSRPLWPRATSSKCLLLAKVINDNIWLDVETAIQGNTMEDEVKQLEECVEEVDS
jgi:hypothetical protein